ncbi:hypothetical protein EJ110_NYTH34540 [Nymphaea thermarum]|nr:hypothetical protein EJ110_NYTH34540 [Nymphaea thermarum]
MLNAGEPSQEQRTQLISVIPLIQPPIAPLFQPPISTGVAFGSFGQAIPTRNARPAAKLNSVSDGMNSGTVPSHSNSRPDAPTGFFPNSSTGFYGGTESARFKPKPTKIDFPRFSETIYIAGYLKPSSFSSARDLGDNEGGSCCHELRRESIIHWYQRLIAQHGWLDWRTLITAMAAHFGPSAYVDYNQELSKIRQTGSVVDYHEHFEELSNMVRGWPMEALIGAFVGELKDEIRTEVQGMRPLNLHDYFAIARMVEGKQQRYHNLGALDCEINQQPAFDVVVGDGSTLKCKGRCTDEKTGQWVFSAVVYTSNDRRPCLGDSLVERAGRGERIGEGGLRVQSHDGVGSLVVERNVLRPDKDVVDEVWCFRDSAMALHFAFCVVRGEEEGRKNEKKDGLGWASGRAGPGRPDKNVKIKARKQYLANPRPGPFINGPGRANVISGLGLLLMYEARPGPIDNGLSGLSRAFGQGGPGRA